MSEVPRKNVALFIRSLHKGGAEKQSIVLTRQLSHIYNTWLIVMFRDGEYLEHAINNDLKVVFLPGNILQKSFHLYQFLKSKKINILINYLPVNNIIGDVVGRLSGVDFIYGGIRGAALKKSRLKMLLMKFLCSTSI